MTKSELGRDIMTNPVLYVIGNALLTALLKSPAGGARTLVHAGLVNPEDNGKYFAFYQSDAEYKAYVDAYLATLSMATNRD